MDDILIAEIAKNSRERLRIQLREFKGHRFIDLRLFAISADGDFVPTRTGIGFRPDLIDAVVEALEAAQRKAAGQGHSTGGVR
ncbi:transcriptional coactivator p15/PC4 family protein [Methylobacterium iners]|uniref:Transcriptional coactivator p15 (PC4) C-terminal domain-containing protein n=1 Tax=Methylobacterium iners TaxID=418707 RepID=A0ABQ4RX34_9HYPH|nr:transcriptional coactivator p15/PC4 family protein [Methylobacterium iners]GJD95216.1 hypothetical protein OCOJLMKI_2426 [Methylobacterium iners]